MEFSFITNAELDGSILSSLQKEVDAATEAFGAEIIFLLIEKWDQDIEKAKQENSLTKEKLLNYYIGLKISLHHLRKKYEKFYTWNDLVIENKIRQLSVKTKEARRDYYVAKRRVEGCHGSECSCRGCRCIKQVSG